ncbi:MAG: sigma-54-dependent Fis family transcriptional regulator [Betaproteobacteria bacterium]|nr:sigma-54-dependent Fis family transcriptional regulator [Betaproteobacteria bacterium]
MRHILIVDDEAGIRELLSEILSDEGYQVALAENAAQARAFRARNRPDLVLLDIWMPDTDGVTLLREWASAGLLTMPVVMMSGHATIDTAVEATRIGAFDFLEKPIGLQKLLATVTKALTRARHDSAPSLSLDSLGRSPVIAGLRKRLEQLMASRAPVLLTGEPGCGAELCARFLHQPNTPWLECANPAALAEAPLELLEQARDGLLFCPEIGDLNRMEQKGLLLVAGRLDKYNVRLVTATSRSLPDLVAAGQYDAQIYQAAATISIGVPSLREHREDIPDLANLVLSRCVESGEAPLRQFTTAALNALRNYDWPGNLTQFNGVVRTLALTALGAQITAEDVDAAISREARAGAPALPIDLEQPLREARDQFEKLYFEHHLARENGNISRVAEKAGLERTHLYRKLKQLEVRYLKKGGE